MKRSISHKKQRRNRISKIGPHKITIPETFPMHLIDNTKDIDLLLKKSKLFQDMIGFSSDYMSTLFEKAAGLLQQHRYEEATQSFQLLTQLNPYISEFWIGLGMSYQLQTKYQEALSYFTVAIALDPDRVDAYSYAVDCCIEMKRYDLAHLLVKQGIDHRRKMAPSKEDSSSLKEFHQLSQRIIS